MARTSYDFRALLALRLALPAAALLAAVAFAPGAAAQDVGCKGDIVLNPGHGGAIRAP